jgi:membrane protease YdiL (CAAX protease family)
MSFSVLLITTLFPIFLTFVIALRKDKYEVKEPLFLKQTWSCHDILVLLGIILLAQFLGLFLVYTEAVTLYMIRAYSVFFFFTIGCCLFVIVHYKYGSGISELGFSRNELSANLILGLKVSFLFEFVILLIPTVLGREQILLNRSQEFISLRVAEMPLHQLAIYLTGLLVAAPIVEEGIFRGFMYSPFRRKIGHKGSMLFTSLIWSIGHHNFKSIGSLVILGIILAYLYAKRQSLIPNIVMHTMNSLVSLLIFLYLKIVENQCVFAFKWRSFILSLEVVLLVGFLVTAVIARKISQTKVKRGRP